MEELSTPSTHFLPEGWFVFFSALKTGSEDYRNTRPSESIEIETEIEIEIEKRLDLTLESSKALSRGADKILKYDLDT